ncbi:AI-2E family transporter [Candidatus Cyrtobacter comes]|uniref:AI-2E family transporter n=1 Tax=Candidatus Cyrtobacter comes TaxID=675776 RepID=A0ABU5L7W1_9RICK|nr:AI-2E family transporter [Candidatus Cyrtobacter comes]MDZ5761965.1 AI-2E family transporter [Candidatus Cyrtobacter comes]
MYIKNIAFFLIVIVLAFFLYQSAAAALPFFIGFIVAYALKPSSDILCKKLNVNRAISSLIITIAFFGSLIVLSILIWPVVVFQIRSLANKLVFYEKHYRTLIEDTFSWIYESFPSISTQIQALAATISEKIFFFLNNIIFSMLQSGMMIINLAFILIIAPIVCFYLLRDWDEFAKFIKGLVPRRWITPFRRILNEIRGVLNGFFIGQSIVALIVGIYHYLLFLSLNMEYALGLGVISGTMVFIPYIGTLITTSLSCCAYIIQIDIDSKIYFLIFGLTLSNILENLVITPKIVGSKVGVHPLIVLFVLLVSGRFFGLFGMLFAIPAAGSISVVLKFAILRYKRSLFYKNNNSDE